ncbi:MAG: signal recognition particle-docking protein FtsY [Gammaproteobacteria bacterium]|nr:signal recognition particle-docking protein FtsY [Gammaproteobacteria bacterium]
MFKFKKSQPKSTTTENAEPASPQGWLSRLRGGLKRSRQQLANNLVELVRGKKTIDAELLNELEAILLRADLGIDTTENILEKLRNKIDRHEVNDAEALIGTLKQLLVEIITPYAIPLEITAKPYTILMVGVNGAGKTTSIAKLANFYKHQNLKVMLGAGDTFRAAAVEQLQTWGTRNDVPVIAQQSGADSASVVYDALQATQARNYDLLIADTAGRLHTQDHLMTELKKIKRVMQKLDPNAPQETMLVLDASMGQNALNQAQQFHETVGLTGITLTQLDGTAKGGLVFAIADTIKLPLRFIGIGEGIDDLKPFDANEFVEALFAKD